VVGIPNENNDRTRCACHRQCLPGTNDILPAVVLSNAALAAARQPTTIHDTGPPLWAAAEHTTPMQEASTRKIYDVHSVFYDATFGRLVRRRIADAISHLNLEPHHRVLDMGIGTGTSLKYYPLDRGQIIGIDLSGGMLREAKKKIRAQGRQNARLLQADALKLPFGEDTFDQVFISHVISVVSDPCRLICEAQRVAKPGAPIVIVNHFQSTNRFIALIEKWLCPLCTSLGWRSDLALQDIIRGTGVEIDFRYKLDSVDLWETVVMVNTKSTLLANGPRSWSSLANLQEPFGPSPIAQGRVVECALGSAT
jgi:phosphatidylethanolamine/phosphatidyl-N-methylethanolamine N-methyltransferase